MKKLYIFLLPLMVSCSGDPGDINIVPQEQVKVELVVSKDNVPANNFNYAIVNAVLEPNLPGQSVTFTTDRGVFINGLLTYTATTSEESSTVRAYLKCDNVGAAHVTASALGMQGNEVLVNFTTSYPNQILILPGNSTLPAELTSTTAVTAKLSRAYGIVSPNQVVIFYDSIPTGEINTVGSFLNTSSSGPDGTATSQYWVQNTGYSGFVYLKASVDTITHKVIGSNKIYIQESD
jgi:hypothetical protein